MASLSFADFPEDVQLCILSFLSPHDISNFACTSRRFASLFRNDSKLWITMCDRRWGSKTQIKKWGNGKIAYKLLYKTLMEWENLIGFWRRSGHANFAAQSPPLLYFEWGPSFLTGSRVSPSRDGTDRVLKTPFLWMSLTQDGQIVNFLVPDGKTDLSGDFANLDQLGFSELDLIPVNLCFMGKTHFVIEENVCYAYANSQEQNRKNGSKTSSSSTNLQGEDCEDLMGTESRSPGSLPDRLMSEIYQYFANRTSPGAERALRRQRRREREKQSRRKWEPEHFVKIVSCSPTPSRPLQGLWKGLCDERNLEFCLVAYDDLGGITCRRVGDSSERFSGSAPVFWTSNATFIESPFSPEEESLYNSRIHIQPVAAVDDAFAQLSVTQNDLVSRILYINSSYDLVIPDMAGTSTNPRHVEGRIWQYWNGTFGFGFLRDNVIIDLKHISKNGHLLDSMELS